MKYELIIAHGANIQKPPIVDGVEIVWQRNGQPGKMTFTVVKTKGLSFSEGDAVRFSVGGKAVFYGFIFEKSRTGLEDKKLNVVVYDQLFYLTQNKDTYVFENKTASAIIKMLAEDFHLNLGKITPTAFNIESLVMDNKSLYDMIAEALKITTQATQQVYVLYDKAGKLTLSNIAEMTLDYAIDEKVVGSTFDYKTSIAEDTYNRIKLTHEDKEGGSRQVAIATDPAKISKWGVLQYYEKVDSGTMIQKRAIGLLSMYDSKSRTLSLRDVLGDKRVRGGSLLPCKLYLGDINLSNYMLVDQVRHTFRENEHLMSVTFEEYRPLADVSNAQTALIVTEIPKEESGSEEGSGGGSSSGGTTGNIRTTRPSDDNKYYKTVGGGGYNHCIAGNASNGRTSSTSVIPNCVGYAYGRYMEIRGITSCNLPTGNANTWYSTAQSRGFDCSQTPTVGSVAVFGGTQYGHVAVVEEIKPNGDLVLSESNWSHSPFRNVTIKKSNGYNYSNSLHLLGFIH